MSSGADCNLAWAAGVFDYGGYIKEKNRTLYLRVRVLPHFYGHLGKAHNEPGGCHDTETEVFSGVQA